MTDVIQLQEIATRFGFKNVIKFSAWVEDNDLGEILFGLDEEDFEKGTKEIDKDSIKYKSIILALNMLSIKEIQNMDLNNLTSHQWLELSKTTQKRTQRK